MKNPHPRTKLTSLLATACLALAPVALAVDPPPGGGYPGNNTALGDDALFSLTTGTDNTALGFNALYDDTTGYSNTAIGSSVLVNNTTGAANTAMGLYALLMNTTGGANTAIGTNALQFNTSGGFNTAVGVGTLYQNTTGYSNTATGLGALENNTTGYSNTAAGVNCLFYNTTGYVNTAVGDQALNSNGTGIGNTALGQSALVFNQTGSYNTVIGFNAMTKVTKGSSNIAIGYSAGSNCTGSYNIMIGNVGSKHDSSAIRIGVPGTQETAFIAGISGTTVPTGVAVVVDQNGQLGTVTSSARYKEAIKPMDNASEAILELKPVTFRYKHELDPAGIPQFGLVAEQVAKIDPDLVARDDQGKPYTVRYEAVNAMLLNEFLKEHRGVQDLKNTVTKQGEMIVQEQQEIKALTATLKAQAAQIQKVSDQLNTQSPAPRVVAN